MPNFLTDIYPFQTTTAISDLVIFVQKRKNNFSMQARGLGCAITTTEPASKFQCWKHFCASKNAKPCLFSARHFQKGRGLNLTFPCQESRIKTY